MISSKTDASLLPDDPRFSHGDQLAEMLDSARALATRLASVSRHCDNLRLAKALALNVVDVLESLHKP